MFYKHSTRQSITGGMLATNRHSSFSLRELFAICISVIREVLASSSSSSSALSARSSYQGESRNRRHCRDIHVLNTVVVIAHMQLTGRSDSSLY